MPEESRLALELRRFEPEDRQPAADIIHRATSAAYSFMPWTHSLEDTRAWFVASLSTWSQIWVAMREGRVTGVLCLDGNHIDQLFVDPVEQRRGVGSLLLRKALELSTPPVSLRTFQKNRAARAFYEKHGFRAIAFGVSEAEGEPDVLYRLAPSDALTPG